MSISGSLLILVLLLAKRFLKEKISRQWQYYIWLIVILRLLLPFGSERTLLGKTYQAVDQAITQSVPSPKQQPAPNATRSGFAPAIKDNENPNSLEENLTIAYPLQDSKMLVINHIWLAIALGMLIRKITIYQGFIQYIKAGWNPISDTEILDQLSIVAKQAGIKKPIELCVNPLVSSPLLIGFFRPCIVLPSADISKKNFCYIVLHELMHYKRRDMFYKWLVQVVVCLHWFNPFVHLMNREITKACEFSCDEAVLSKMGRENAQDYGKTLLDAMAAVGRYKESLGAVTLSENKQLLKERLGAIMNFKKKSKTIQLLTGVLTLCIIVGASFVGVYPVAAAVEVPSSTNMEQLLPSQSDNELMADDSPVMETLDFRGKTYYLVHNETQLRAIGTGQYGMDQNYMQQADIWLSADEWVPIGTWDNPFTGTYTGNGFEIIGLTMTDPNAEIIGLFGVAQNAHIYNITLQDYDIVDAGQNVANKSVGAILAIGRWVRCYDNFVYPKETNVNHEDASSQIEQYYKDNSLPLFQMAFGSLDEKEQGKWLDRIYTDNRIAFWGTAIGVLDEDCALIQRYAEKTYANDSIAYFSALAMYMSDETLEVWLDRALEDKNTWFQSVLFNALDRDDEFDKLEEKQEKEWAEARMAEYGAVGVTIDGKNYYYQGQLVNIFLDIVQRDQSFYTLDMNPKGTINIKIIRDTDNKITGVIDMTEEEVTKLLGDMGD